MNEDKIINALLELSEMAAVSGGEEAAVAAAARYLKTYVSDIKRDCFGNLLAFKPGENATGRPALTIALVAHADEIGAMVTKIEPGGFLRFTPIGGLDPRTLPGQPVTVHGKKKFPGVIGAAPPHLLTKKERGETTPMEKLFIDIGMDQEQAADKVKVGDIISLEQHPVALKNGKMMTGKSLDNRAGIAVLIACAAGLSRLYHSVDVVFIASLQEEVGLRGAITAAYGLNPDLAVAIDVTHGDAPELEEGRFFKLGKGPVVAKGPNLHPALVDRLEKTAGKYFLPVQREPIPDHSGTDAWAFQVAREGIPTALLSIPLRYMHTAVEMINLDDLFNCVKVLGYFIGGLNRTFLEDMKKC
ncbi:MAG: M20/M25/M40 family metallo-hydrolase [Bacillota bacterium]|nr:M20/M25/M40 family metallo-hydrolase [Bacillota bacterium]